MSALCEGASGTVTGDDMAQLIKVIDNQDIFKNYQVVNSAMELRNILFVELLNKLNSVVDEYRLQ